MHTHAVCHSALSPLVAQHAPLLSLLTGQSLWLAEAPPLIELCRAASVGLRNPVCLRYAPLWDTLFLPSNLSHLVWGDFFNLPCCAACVGQRQPGVLSLSLCWTHSFLLATSSCWEFSFFMLEFFFFMLFRAAQCGPELVRLCGAPLLSRVGPKPMCVRPLHSTLC